MLISSFKDFALAGSAKFSICIKEETFNYVIRKKQGDVYFVYGNGKYICTIFEDELYFAKSEYSHDHHIIATFNFVWKLAVIKKDDSRVQIKHNGRCSRCGRELTDEVSIERGLGPHCATKN